MNETPEIAVTIPHLRQVGRYLFYMPCAFGLALLVTITLIEIGVNREWAKEAIMPVALAAFLALRDLEKNAEARARAALSQAGGASE